MRPGTYQTFTRADWALLRASTPLTLSLDDLVSLRGINESVSLDELAVVYLPLSRLLNLHVRAARNLNGVTDAFLGRPIAGHSYVIAIAGSVAVGKSTFARVLQALMARWPDHPQVDLVTTDGFLFPNRQLEEKQLMRRKGFPESYDVKRMVQFLVDVKAGRPEVRAPVYSDQTYDIVPDQWQNVRRPDVLIFEGLNVLQPGHSANGPLPSFFPISSTFPSTWTPKHRTSRPGTLIASLSCSARRSKSRARTSITTRILGPQRRLRLADESGPT